MFLAYVQHSTEWSTLKGYHRNWYLGQRHRWYEALVCESGGCLLGGNAIHLWNLAVVWGVGTAFWCVYCLGGAKESWGTALLSAKSTLQLLLWESACFQSHGE